MIPRSRIKSRARLIAVLCLLPLLGACGPAFERYRYITLESYPDARVVEQGGGEGPGQVFFVGRIPFLFEIKRDRYTLLLNARDGAPDPWVSISVDPWPELTLRFPDARKMDAPRPCVGRFDPDPERPRWWTYSVTSCIAKKKPFEKVIRLEILDQNGQVIGREAIPFEVKGKGFHVYMDYL